MDLKIFIDTEEEVALKRRLKRDLIERGYSEEDILYKWHHHVVPSYREYLLPYRDECSRVITNNTHVAEDIIKITEEISSDLKQKLDFK
jgi:uridine kinase